MLNSKYIFHLALLFDNITLEIQVFKYLSTGYSPYIKFSQTQLIHSGLHISRHLKLAFSEIHLQTIKQNQTYSLNKKCSFHHLLPLCD